MRLLAIIVCLRSYAKHAVLALLLTGHCTSVSATPTDSELVFRRLTPENGLSSSYVNALLEDDRGYIWIGTNDGLNRYDGYECRVHRFHPEDPEGISGSFIHHLQKGPRGTLLVFPGIGGIDLYDPRDERFRHLVFESIPSGRGPNVHSAAWDGLDRLWTAAPQGLHVLPSPVDSVLVHIPLDAAVVIKGVVAASGGGIWLLTSKGLFHADSGSADAIIEQAKERPDGALALPGELVLNRLVTALEEDSESIWVGTQGGMVLRAQSGFDFLPCTSSAASDSSGVTATSGTDLLDGGATTRHPTTSGYPVARILPDSRGGAWVIRNPLGLDWVDSAGQVHAIVLDALAEAGGTDITLDATGRGVFVGSSAGVIHVMLSEEGSPATTLQFQFDPKDERSLGANRVSALVSDRRGGLWVGTTGGGVSHHDPYRVRFRAAPWPPASLGDPSTAAVEAVLEDDAGRLWLGTAGGLVAPPNTVYRVVSEADARTADLSPQSARVLDLFRDHAGVLWLGTDFGLARAVRNAKSAGKSNEKEEDIPFVFELGEPDDPIAINDILEDPSGGLWLATHSGLFWFDPPTKRTRAYRSDPDDPRSLPSSTCVSLAFDLRGDLWIGTFVGGLSRHLGNGQFENYGPRPGQRGGLNNLSVLSIHPSRDGRFLWIGTYSGGLNRLDLASGQFKAWTEKDGLPGDKINAIVEDDRGLLWLTTNHGLARFDVETGKITCYDAGDGLPGNEFSPRAAIAMRDGRLALAGTSGYTIFDPSAVPSDPIAPPIVLTAFRTFDRVVPLGEAMDDDGRLSLSHREDFISFEFAALDFSAPPRARYSYKLEGMDREWIESGVRRFASYTDLDPGRYVFRVRATNRDGVSDEAGFSLPLVVQPPFWRTLWFGSLSLAVVVMTLLAIHRREVRARVRRSLAEERIRALERERVRGEVARDYHDEVGVQLTRISLYAELVRRDLESLASVETRAFLGKIADSAQLLTRRTREFLWTLDLRKNRIADLLAYLEESGRALFEDSDTQFEVQHADRETAEQELGPERKRHLALLFREALHNASKHARARTVVVWAQQADGEIVIEVGDNGIGFDLDPAERSATGQGLANLKSRATEAGGRIVVETRPGLGTRVRFEGPIEPKSPESGTPQKGALERTLS